MGKDRLSKYESGGLLYHRFHVVTKSKELRHITKNFANIVGDYLGE